MKIMLWLILCLPLLNMAQEQNEGIRFAQGLTWEQVKIKARAEKKYIFVDCFATWCGPCKQMEERVYPLKIVGDAYNNKFVSVKLQMDKTFYDDQDTKDWYLNAKYFKSNYSITAFPTFLFFSPEGRPLHKVTGGLSADAFLKLANDALDSSRQFYTLVKAFRPGIIDTSELKGLARLFKYNDKELSGKMAADYLSRIPLEALDAIDNLWFISEFQDNPTVLEIAISYLNKNVQKELIEKINLRFIASLKKQPQVQDIVVRYVSSLDSKEFIRKKNLDLISLFKDVSRVHDIALKNLNKLGDKVIYTKDILEFSEGFIQTPFDQYFDMFYKNGTKVNTIVGRNDFSQQVIDRVIFKNEINPIITTTKEYLIPGFNEIYETIKNKYGIDYADRTILNAKVTFYRYRANKLNSNWEEYFKYAIEKVEKYQTDTTNLLAEADLNNIAWDIFIHSSDKNKMMIAIKWMEDVIRRGINNLAASTDTYANLLYKYGRKNDALIMEAKACELQPNNKDFKKCLMRMTNDEPTWDVTINTKPIK